MKTSVIIPARYNSSRLPGKVIMKICEKPIIWWVYQQVRKSRILEQVFIAADDFRVIEVCNEYSIPSIMTKSTHESHLDRLHEVSESIASDLYVCVCADEPLVKAATIEKVLPQQNETDEFIARTLMRELQDPAETIDPSNLKLITDKDDYAILITRGVLPYPYKSTQFHYKKVVGIECYNKEALDFFANTSSGNLEKIEGTNLLRFIEYRKPLKCIMTDDYQLSIDTANDFEKVSKIMTEMLENGDLQIP